MSYCNPVEGKIKLEIYIEMGDFMSSRKVNGNLNVIGDTLRKYRKQKKLSQAGLARELNLLGILIHKNDIGFIEANKRTVKDYELWGFHKVLGVPLDMFFTDIDNKLGNND